MYSVCTTATVWAYMYWRQSDNSPVEFLRFVSHERIYIYIVFVYVYIVVCTSYRRVFDIISVRGKRESAKKIGVGFTTKIVFAQNFIGFYKLTTNAFHDTNKLQTHYLFPVSWFMAGPCPDSVCRYTRLPNWYTHEIRACIRRVYVFLYTRINNNTFIRTYRNPETEKTIV